MKLILGLITLTLSACSFFTIGDGMFVVRGVAPGDCLLTVAGSGGEVADRDVREVRGRFIEDFVVSPESAAYDVKLQCGSKLIRKANVIYPQEVGVGGVLDLEGQSHGT